MKQINGGRQTVLDIFCSLAVTQRAGERSKKGICIRTAERQGAFNSERKKKKMGG
jgi:hypothetical protein